MTSTVVNDNEPSTFSLANLSIDKPIQGCKNKIDNNEKEKEEDEEEDEEDNEEIDGIKFVNYRDESDLASVMALVGRDLSEPYSSLHTVIFLNQFPDLCILAVPTRNKQQGSVSDDNNDENKHEEISTEPIGCVVCKVDEEESPYYPNVYDGNNSIGDTDKMMTNNSCGSQQSTTCKSKTTLSGYMAMLAVDTSYRKSGIGTALVKRAVRRMRKRGCSSVTLETEVSNKAAIRLYEDRLGFVREELLVRYYLNWGDAYRLRLWFD
eukprot:CAMPEP_0197827814 /NCGR_PEP_ID=MMETSP1437-20131217/4516_1 /TAXON_ID=49252 ORGANISM="Eucampia antarctica, Strain CCMP1452" /NCGR_SAMPLE_ID=MMETSP1437 /ASSEMBLY_ACC=CAM_ASM_001096 /LENGTH=264 /DNA_ID=CAMNT_0043428807 /DNA_START=16 /DNA_END=808 /DNA_ORIENTATION=-